LIQCRCGLSLALKSSQRARIASHLVRQELESHETMQANVLGPIHDAHSTTAKLFIDPVVGNPAAENG
jgi:hypothetical protein